MAMKIPDNFAEKLIQELGPEIKTVIDEINSFTNKQSFRIASLIELSSPYTDLSFIGGSDGQIIRSGDKLSYDRIEKMKKSGPVMFALWMKMAPVIRVFSSGRYKLESPDKEIVDISNASLRSVMPKMITDLVYNMFCDGTSFQVKRFERKTKYELGLSKSRAAGTSFVVPKVPESIAAYSVRYINEKKSGDFNGFTVRAKKKRKERNIAAADSLVVPMWGGWHNSLWGDPFLTQLYPLWVWYEITMRALARHLDVVAKHIFIVRAPSQGTVEIEGEGHDAMDVALTMATSLSKSTALAIPSDRYRQGDGELMWDIEEYKADTKEGLFIGVLSWICNQMIRAALTADASVQSGDSAGYNIGVVHERASSVTTEIILMTVLHFLNRYFFPDISLYNKGVGGPPLYATTQPIDLLERELLMKILNVAGNSESGEEFFDMVDWRGLSEIANVPHLTEDEVKKKLKEREKEAKRKMEEFGFNPDNPDQGGNQPPKEDGEQDDSNGDQSSSDGDTTSNQDVFRKVVELMVQSGQKLPLFLSKDDLNGIPVKVV